MKPWKVYVNSNSTSNTGHFAFWDGGIPAFTGISYYVVADVKIFRQMQQCLIALMSLLLEGLML